MRSAARLKNTLFAFFTAQKYNIACMIKRAPEDLAKQAPYGSSRFPSESCARLALRCDCLNWSRPVQSKSHLSVFRAAAPRIGGLAGWVCLDLRPSRNERNGRGDKGRRSQGSKCYAQGFQDVCLNRRLRFRTLSWRQRDKSAADRRAQSAALHVMNGRKTTILSLASTVSRWAPWNSSNPYQLGSLVGVTQALEKLQC